MPDPKPPLVESPPSDRTSTLQDRADKEPLANATATDVLEVLGDETTRKILQTVSKTGKTGREISDKVNVSRATVYRRLGELRDYGLIEDDVRFDPDGHHRKEFRSTVSCLEVDLLADKLVSTEGDRM